MWELTSGWRLFLHDDDIAIIDKILNTLWRFAKMDRQTKTQDEGIAKT
jgi:hypothetical protein